MLSLGSSQPKAPQDIHVIQGNCLELLPEMTPESVDAIFADPPYFLSNGGQTCKNGKRSKVDKGQWDASKGLEQDHQFHHAWLSQCQRVLKKDGTIWISATHHTLFSIGFALQELGYKILNLITWEKPNPPPNLSCRYFTHSTEQIIWAAKNPGSKHIFNYADMKAENGARQMKTVWRFPAPSKAEKTHGKHPTQKPVALVQRCILASTSEGDLVLDPFCGSGTTGIACIQTRRRFIGIELSEEYVRIAEKRINADRLRKT